jgi:ribonuclease-3
MPTFSKLIDTLGLQFNDPTLLQNALTHRSYVHEHYRTTLEPNERLEFLGDGVLNMITAQFLYETYPDQPEGQLTAMRAVLVRTATLAAFARQFNLGTYIKLGKGEERSGGREREALLADAFEAVMAAIYLDQGLDAARRFLLPLLETQREVIVEQDMLQDDRSRLQERVQADRNETPRYRTLSAEGPDHSRMFTVEVFAGDEQLGVGVGASKQAASQAAARAALTSLDGNDGSEAAVPDAEEVPENQEAKELRS